MARRPRRAPNSYLVARGAWPAGPFEPDAPPYVAVVSHIARELSQALTAQGKSQRAAASAAGLTPSTVNDLVNGALIPDAATLASLEHALGVKLWPVGLPE